MLCIGHIRLIHGHYSRNYKQLTCRNATCGNQTDNQTLPPSVLTIEGQQKIYPGQYKNINRKKLKSGK